jgi:hypothetical protein
LKGAQVIRSRGQTRRKLFGSDKRRIVVAPICRHTAQALLSLATNFPTIHSRLLANVRAFSLCSLFPFLTHGLALLPRSISGYMNLRRLWWRRHPAPIGRVCRRQGCRGRSPQDQFESVILPDTTTQPLGPAARNAFDRVTAIFSALSVG